MYFSGPIRGPTIFQFVSGSDDGFVNVPPIRSIPFMNHITFWPDAECRHTMSTCPSKL